MLYRATLASDGRLPCRTWNARYVAFTGHKRALTECAYAARAFRSQPHHVLSSKSSGTGFLSEFPTRDQPAKLAHREWGSHWIRTNHLHRSYSNDLSIHNAKDATSPQFLPKELLQATTIGAWISRLNMHMQTQSHSIQHWYLIFSLSWKKFGALGVKSTFQVFAAIEQAHTSQPCLYDSPDLFKFILQAALHSPAMHRPTVQAKSSTIRLGGTEQFIETLCIYMQSQLLDSRRRPSKQCHAYPTIMNFLLVHEPDAAVEFYNFFSIYSPSKEEITDLVLRLEPKKEAHERLQQLCFSYPSFQDMYDNVIPSLFYRSNNIDLITSWHNALVAKGHLSSESDPLRKLTSHLQKANRRVDASKLLQAAQDATVTDFRDIGEDLEKRFPQGHIPRAQWGDKEWARIYATRFLSLNVVIRCLTLFDARMLGPLSTRQLLLRCINGRELDKEQLKAHLEALAEVDIVHDTSVYCRLVARLARTGNARLLYDMATCDVHPEEFDNRVVQESLLAHYENTDDSTQAQRTFEALLLDSTDSNRESKRLNILLRSCISRNDDMAIDSAVDKINDSQIPLEANTISWMFKKLLPERLTRDLPPRSQLNRLVGIWASFMDGGTYISPSNWDDILRTLLICGNIDAHENLCLRITQWYGSLYKGMPFAREVFKSTQLKNQNDSSRHSLFRAPCINEILVYSFYHGSFMHQSLLKKSMAPHERAALLASHPIFRGLRFLLHLRDHGVNVDVALIQKILMKRIWIICHHGLPLASGAVVKRVTNASERDYHRAAEILIGKRNTFLNNKDRKARKRRKLFYEPMPSLASTENSNVDSATHSRKSLRADLGEE